jgi:hypothetical protein
MKIEQVLLCMYQIYLSQYIDWLIDYLRFYDLLQNFSLIWRCHHCRWRAAKFRPMLGAQGLWAGWDLYRATPAVTRGLGFSGLIRRTAPISRLLRHTWGCWGSILTRIITGNQYIEKTYKQNSIFFFEHMLLGISRVSQYLVLAISEISF